MASAVPDLVGREREVVLLTRLLTEAELEESCEPIAATLAPAYHEATHQRGTMTVVTASTTEDLPDAGPDDGAAPAAPAGGGTTIETSGCGVAPSAPGSAMALALGVAAASVLARRRRAR